MNYQRLFYLVAEAGLEPTTFGLCLPTTVFTASNDLLEFVVWTVPLPATELLRYLPTSLYTFSLNFLKELGSGLPY